MKPQTLHEDMTTEGNLADFGERIKMRVSQDAADQQHIMSIMTNMYSDRIKACIREYSTNARDANVMAGRADKPIEVSLPGSLSPYFKVRDYGDGLSLDDMRNTYSQYGSSTKRATNDANGILGIGAKSALTYTSTFTITSINDGLRHVVMVKTDEDGVGEFVVLSSAPSNEPSGVEISIPVKMGDANSFISKAQEFFGWWDSSHYTGLVAAKREPLDTIGNLSTYSRFEVGQDLVVMGGVAYPLPNDVTFADFDRDFSIVAFAQMGEVNFPPNREQLMNTSLVRKYVEKVRLEFAETIRKKWQSKVDSEAKSAVESLDIARTMNQTYGSMNITLTYKGRAIPSPVDDVFKAPSHNETVKDTAGQPKLDGLGKPITRNVLDPFFLVSTRTGVRETPQSVISIPEDSRYLNGRRVSSLAIPRTSLVLGAPKTVNSNHRAVIRQYNDTVANGSKSYYIFVAADKAPGDGWLEGLTTITWSDIKSAVRVKRAPANRDKALYLTWTRFAGEEQSKVKDNAKVIFVTPAIFRERSINRRSIFDFAESHGYEHRIVLLNRNLHSKFKREHPNAVEFDVALTKAYMAWYDGLTPAVREAYSFSRQVPAFYQSIVPYVNDIEDPALKASTLEVIRVNDVAREVGVKMSYYQALCNAMGMTLNVSFPNAKGFDSVIRDAKRYENYCPRHYLRAPELMTVINALYHYRKATP